ncbi:MAG: hypothetical protein H0T50_15655 [Gemmatimonadales bacterium]|nr:hypothetical protein [Gemmatimonadales bacterium]
MKHFLEWSAQHVRPEEPWLILGKGPSFALRSRYDLSGYHLLSLNHAVREQSVLVAHAIDLNVVEACADVLEFQTRFLVLPWYPHVDNQPGTLSVDELRPNFPLLQRLADAGRLLWYDLSTSPVRHGPGPVVQATYFSAEAALNLLALAGVHRIRTLGVDGGTTYSNDFDDLKDKTLLANGRPSFDVQFQGFARTILETGVDVATLQAPSPVRIYVAHTEEEELPVAVLRHSVRRHASLSVEFVTLPAGSVSSDHGETPAIVLSPRAHCVADVRPLWMGGVGEGEIATPVDSPRYGDAIGLALVGTGCGSEVGHLARLLRAGSSAARLGALRPATRARLGSEWNPDTKFQAGRSRFVRYPPDGSEPWLSRTNPVGHLWVRDLLDAITRGTIGVDLLAAAIRRGHVRPSLGYQVEHRIEEPLLLPRRARLLDRGFRPPEGVPVGRQRLAATSVALAQALARCVERRVREYRAQSIRRMLAANR